MRGSRGPTSSHDATARHPHRRYRLAHRFAVVVATPVLCVGAVVAALVDMRATAAVSLGAAVLIEAVLTYRHQVRPRLHRPAESDRVRPVPSGPQHTAPPAHSAEPARSARTAPGGHPAGHTPTFPIGHEAPR
jgi:hypothetical protein